MNWWKSAFSNTYADVFHRLFPEPTLQEIAQIMEWFPLRQYPRVLDLACGEGRHSIVLAMRGYEVVGVDVSKDFLARARADAASLEYPPTFIQQDIRTLALETEFNLVMLIGNSFGYGTDEDQRQVLNVAASHLVPEGMFLLSLPNGDRSIARFDAQGSIREAYQLDGERIEIQEDYTFDTTTSVKSSVWSIRRNGKIIYEQEAYVRFYKQDEIVCMLNQAGFNIVKVYGGFYDKRFDTKSPHLVIHAVKTKMAT